MNAVAVESLLKQKQTYLNKLNGEIEAKKTEKSHLDKELNVLIGKQKALNEEIKKLQENSGELIISEHAIIRYIERVIGININDIKEAIYSETLINQVSILGNGNYPIGNGVKAVVKNNVVVTIE
jgi:predicted nuclease with TOPRIM domain